VAAARAPVVSEETVLLDGEPRTYLSVKCPLRDARGQVHGVFGVSTDISERKNAELRLQAQLERMELLDQITSAIGERQDLQSIYQVAIRSLEERLPVDFSCVCRYDPMDNQLTVTRVGVHSAALALELAMPENATVPIDENGLSRCVRGHLVYEADLAEVAFPFPQRLLRAACIAGGGAIAVGEPCLRRADRGAPQARFVQQRRMRVLAPAERARRAGAQAGRAACIAAARLR
jgi:hypothetical protein